MPDGGCTLVPMEVGWVLMFAWGSRCWLEADDACFDNGNDPSLVCPLGIAIGGHRCGSEAGPWAWPLSVYLAFPQCGWIWAVGAPFGLGSASVLVGGGGGVCVWGEA